MLDQSIGGLGVHVLESTGVLELDCTLDHVDGGYDLSTKCSWSGRQG